jgi:hypothetical protein
MCKGKKENIVKIVEIPICSRFEIPPQPSNVGKQHTR